MIFFSHYVRPRINQDTALEPPMLQLTGIGKEGESASQENYWLN